MVAPSSGPPWGVLPGRNPSWSPGDHLLHHNGNPTLSPRNRTSRFCEHHRPTNGNGQPVPSQPIVFPGFCCDLGQICCRPEDDATARHNGAAQRRDTTARHNGARNTDYGQPPQKRFESGPAAGSATFSLGTSRVPAGFAGFSRLAVRFREATGLFGIPGRRRRKQTQPAHSQNVFRVGWRQGSGRAQKGDVPRNVS